MTPSFQFKPSVYFRHFRSRLAGFTLLEVMVSLAIIAILTLLALSAYTNGMQKARLTQVSSSVGIGTANIDRSLRANNIYPSSLPSSGMNTTDFSYAYTASTDGSAYALAGSSSAFGGVWAGSNYSGIRCKCTSCSLPSFTPATLTCPSGTSSW